MPRIELKRGMVVRLPSGRVVALMERETEEVWRCLRLLQFGMEEDPFRAADVLIADEDLLKGKFIWFSESKKEATEPKSTSSLLPRRWRAVLGQDMVRLDLLEGKVEALRDRVSTSESRLDWLEESVNLSGDE